MKRTLTTLIAVTLILGLMTTVVHAQKININTASSSELQSIKGIGPKTAEKIINYRTENGPFATINDITKVKGIGPKTFEKMKDQLTVGAK